MTVPDSAKFYTARQAADALQVSLCTIYRMVDAGRVGVVRVGRSTRSVRIPIREIDLLVKPATTA